MKIARALLLGCAISVAMPAGAPAADRQVSKTGADSGNCIATACLTIGYAVGQAVDGDRVLIGPGLFQEELGVGKHLEIIGAGAGDPALPADPATDTFIKPTSSGSALALRRGGAVRSLRTQGNGGTAFGAGGGLRLRADSAASSGFEADPWSYEVTDVVALGVFDGPEVRRSGLEITDVGSGPSSPKVPVRAVVQRSHFVAGSGGTYAAGVSARWGEDQLPSVEVSLIDSSASGPEDGVGVEARSVETPNAARVRLRLERVQMTDVGKSLDLFAVDTQVFRSNLSSIDYGMTGSASLEVADSLVVGRASSIALRPALTLINGSQPPGSNPATIRNSTLIGESGNPAVFIRRDDKPKSLNLVNSVALALDDPGEAIRIVSFPDDLPVALAADHSLVGGVIEIDLITQVEEPRVIQQTNPVLGAPAFVDAANGDFRLTPGSPLVDAGSSAHLVAGELDLAGTARGVDANGDCLALPDVGAFELQGTPGVPVTASLSGPDSVQAKTAASFTGNAAGAWDFGDGATATGASVRHAFARPGSYTVSLTVPGSPATCSGVATKQVTVVRNPRPKLSKVSLLRKAFEVGKPRKKGNDGTFVRFRLSERARVRFAVKPAQGAQGAARKGAFAKRLKKGRRSVAFSGELKGKALAPGRYTLVLQATDSAKQKSGKKKLRFTVKG